MDIGELDFDVLIVGGGLAALRAAIAAAAAPGLRVGVVVKRKLGRSGASANTTGAYATVYKGDGAKDVAEAHPAAAEDSPEIHFQDTLLGGCFVNDPKLARIACEEGPARLAEMLGWGVPFLRANGHLHRAKSGDHSFARVMMPVNHQGTDETLVLCKMAESLGVKAVENVMALDLVQGGGRIAGAVCLDREAGRLVLVRAKAVVLATGGAGRLFSRTSNPVDVTGDGYAMAFRAGARLRDMEFIQYYPWRCIHPFDQGRMPVQPATFALGGKLFNSDGERFMLRYDPVRKDATFRAIAARGIYDQIRLRKTIDGGVLLDISEVPRDALAKENPRLVRTLAHRGLDAYGVRLILAPEAHFFMGGVAIDEQGGAGVPGLYAAGETAGGIHGGNRLDSTAIPDTQVFGRRAGWAAAAFAKGRPLAPISESAARDVRRRASASAEKAGGSAARLEQMREDLRERMWFHLGIVRTEKTLQDGIAYAEEKRAELADIPQGGAKDLEAAEEIGFLLETGRLCLTAALERTESRGAHFREDHPEQDDAAWRKTLVLSAAAGDGIAVETRDCGLA